MCMFYLFNKQALVPQKQGTFFFFLASFFQPIRKSFLENTLVAAFTSSPYKFRELTLCSEGR